MSLTFLNLWRTAGDSMFRAQFNSIRRIGYRIQPSLCSSQLIELGCSQFNSWNYGIFLDKKRCLWFAHGLYCSIIIQRCLSPDISNTSWYNACRILSRSSDLFGVWIPVFDRSLGPHSTSKSERKCTFHLISMFSFSTNIIKINTT